MKEAEVTMRRMKVSTLYKNRLAVPHRTPKPQHKQWVSCLFTHILLSTYQRDMKEMEQQSQEFFHKIEDLK